MRTTLLASLIILFGVFSSLADDGIPLRYLAINVGNVELTCWESKLCKKDVVENIRSYIATYLPDIIMFSEIYCEAQLIGTQQYGPVLPQGYDGTCHPSINRYSGDVTEYNADDSSHEHECVAWNTKRVELVEGSAKSVFGRNDDYGKKNCNYDFTAFSAMLKIDDRYNITAVAVHPDSMDADCRTYEIAQYWELLANVSAENDNISNLNVIIGGDWNAGKSCNLLGHCTEDIDQVQQPSTFQINYQIGQHFDIYNDTTDQPTAVYVDSIKWLDNEYSNFGSPCTSCGGFYGTMNLEYGSAVGGYNGMPRADGGSGCDHRQVLVDMWLTDENTRTW